MCAHDPGRTDQALGNSTFLEHTRSSERSSFDLLARFGKDAGVGLELEKEVGGIYDWCC